MRKEFVTRHKDTKKFTLTFFDSKKKMEAENQNNSFVNIDPSEQ